MHRRILLVAALLTSALAAPALADPVTVARVDGASVDASPQEVLFTTGGGLKLLDTGAGLTQSIPLAPGTADTDQGRVIDAGAIVEMKLSSFPYRELEEWRAGVLTDLGPLNADFDARGDYVVWSNGALLYRLTVSTGAVMQISDAAVNTGARVATNGDVVFSGHAGTSSGYELYRWRNGVTTQLSHQTPALNAVSPVTDGTDVAYAANSPCCSSTYGSVELFTDGGETDLGSVGDVWADDRDYAVADGWTAFAHLQAPATGPNEAWTRAPSGTLARAFPADGEAHPASVTIGAVSPEGQVLLRTPAGARLAFPGAQSFPLHDESSAFWADGHWYLISADKSTLRRLDLDTAIDGAPPALTSAQTADLSISASITGAPALTCTLDGATYTPCSPTPHLTGLADGTHTFTAAATTMSGSDPTPASVTWTVDQVPPSTPELTVPADGAYLNHSGIDLSWNASTDATSGVADYVVHVDDLAPQTVPANTTTFHVSLGTEGAHTWSVTAEDNAGLKSASPPRTFTLDTITPAPPKAADVQSTNPRPTLTWSSVPDADHYQVTVADSDPVDVTGTQYTVPADLPDGVHHWQVRSVDRAGNVSLWTDEEVLVDLRPSPYAIVGVTINHGAQFTNSADVTLTINRPKFTKQILVSNDGGFGGASPIAVAENLPWHLATAGSERLPRIVYLRFLDGQAGKETYTDDIILDTTAPSVTSARAKRARSHPRTVQLRLKARDGTSGVASSQLTQRKKTPGAWKAFKTRVSLHRKSRKPFFVRVRDKAGNVSHWRRAAIKR